MVPLMKKLKISDVKSEMAAIDWQFLEEEYHNLDTVAKMMCPEGHLVEMTVRQWRKDSSCPVCHHDSIIKRKTKAIENRLIAIDDATYTNGWAIFDNSKLVSYGAFTATPGELPDRIVEIGDWLIGLLEKWQPDTIIIEDIQQQSNVNVFKSLAKLQGVLEYLIKKYDLPYFIVHSQTWKSHNKVAGKSRADQKKSAQLIVQDLYGINATQDECDAILMGKYGVDNFIKNNNNNNNRMVEFDSEE